MGCRLVWFSHHVAQFITVEAKSTVDKNDLKHKFCPYSLDRFNDFLVKKFGCQCMKITVLILSFTFLFKSFVTM